jgi:ankyrin repeat protein
MFKLISIFIISTLLYVVNSDEIHNNFFKIILSNDSDKLTHLLNINTQSNAENIIDVNYIGPDTFTALMIAAQQKNTEIIDILIKNGANVNHAESDGWTALFFSCIFNDNTSIKLLLRSGANSLYESPKGITAIKLCSKNIENSILIEESNKKLLFESLNRLNNLLDASTRGDLDEIIKIINTGYDINSSADNGWTSLMHAISNGNNELVPVLIGNIFLSIYIYVSIYACIYACMYLSIYLSIYLSLIFY